MAHVVTDDGTSIHYESHGSGRPLVLIHGWGFSGRFFDRNVPALAEHARVITLDLRAHGDSEDPGHGYRVARLAADLRDVVEALELEDAVLLGWSLGAPVIWAYLELFGSARVGGAVFVQQVPRQYVGVDWKHAHNTCFDDASLAALQQQVLLDPGFDAAQIDTICATDPSDDERKLMLAEMAKAPADARNKIMADHTRHDWRDLLPRLRLPTLVLVAEKDPNYPVAGPAWVGSAIPGAETVFFAASSHALFFDEAEKFNRVVGGFVDR